MTITLDPRTTALVLIDLQAGIVARPAEPRPAAAVVDACQALAARFRAANAPVVLVHVALDPAAMPSQRVDSPGFPPDGTPPGFDTLVPGLEQPGDIIVLKHHWGAFTGTDLDLQLRRRGVRTIILAGIATNMGVESTARSGWELGYDLVILEDACASRSAEMHRFAVEQILPLIARVTPAAALDFSATTA